MIAFVEGNFIVKSPANIIVDVNGVGYDVHISLNTYEKIQQLKKGRLLTFLKISETEQTLFGFFEETEKALFLQLISVSGVGASTARVMLSGMAPAELANAIANSNESVLEKVKGIGAKTAKRIILELKDKVFRTEIANSGSNQNAWNNNMQTDALNALVSLGIARNSAQEAVKKVFAQNSEIDNLQDIIKLALKNI